MQEKEIDGKAIWSYGNPEAEKVLIQLVGEHEISGIEQEFHAIQDRTSEEFYMIAWRVNNWNDELSPWKAPPAFGEEGLFALWASCQTDRFVGIAAASPSVWFPDFLEYMQENRIQSRLIYLSLGNKEEKTRNLMMSTVGDCIRKLYAWLQECDIPCILEWNPGNHFRESEIRTAKAFAWLLEK